MKQLTDDLTVTQQIAPQMMPGIAAAGFKSLICNRPDGEDADQPAFATIATAAEAVGLRAVHLPIVAGAITEDQQRAFADLLKSLPRPILAYCRSGGRCEALWASLQG